MRSLQMKVHTVLPWWASELDRSPWGQDHTSEGSEAPVLGAEVGRAKIILTGAARTFWAII